MNELMKGPNKRGREDFENAISDDLETQNFQNSSALCQPWWRCISKNLFQEMQGIAVIGVEKYKKFLGENTLRSPSPY
jgi:hypothetical protein